MSANPTQHAGWAGGHKGEPSASIDRRIGYAGKYHSAVSVATTNTASFDGYGAFMLGDGAADAATKIFVEGGATIAGTEFLIRTIYDIAPEKVQSTGGTIYVFKRSGQ